MGLLDSLVPGLGTAVGLGESIYGGIKAGQENKKMQTYLNGQQADNENWYNKNYYSDYTNRANTQALMKNTRDTLKKNNEVAANTAAVTGATPEATAVAKEQSNKTLTDTTSRVAAIGQQWKDGLTDKYMARKNQLGNQEYNNMATNANSYENLMSNGIKQIGNGASGLASSLSTTDTPTSTPMAIATPTTGLTVDPSQTQNSLTVK
jgi:hypothetical protein